MLIPPKYRLTSKISELLQIIEGCKQVIDSIDLPLEIERNIRRQSTLRSALFSARIEGNTSTLDKIDKEVVGILKALNWIQQGGSSNISKNNILFLHKLIGGIGSFRTEASAIFNTAGIAVYIPPRPSQITSLISDLLDYANGQKEIFIPIKAVLAHYNFEKIHPFLDGNGRVGRLLLQLILKKGNFGMKGLLSLEEFLDNNRAEYYRVLNEKNITNYIEFILEAIAKTAQIAKELVLEKREIKIEDRLLPRRAEILNIIKDQKLVSFDNIRRRFLNVNERTLRNDLKKLQDQGLIIKRGSTKGVYYEFKA